MNKGKIILIGPMPPPMGGIAKYCQDIMSSYLAKKYSIFFFNITIPLKIRPKAYTKKTNSNILLRDGFFNVIAQLKFVYSNFRKYIKLLATKEYSLVHIISCTGLGFWRNFIFVVISKLKKIKVIWHVVGEIDVFYLTGSAFRKYFITKALNQANEIIVQSEGLKQIVQKMTKTPVKAVYNGVDISDFENNNLKAFTTTKNINVISVGALGMRKGYFDLIKIAEEFKNENVDNIKFTFVGGGEVEKFRKIIKDKDLEDYIYIAGQVDNEKKVELLKASDIFILATYAEGQPIALLEGIASGLPVISTNVGSITEIIKKKNGFIVSPGEIFDIKSTILKLANSPSLRNDMSKHNYLEAKEKYSLTRVFHEIEESYENTMI